MISEYLAKPIGKRTIAHCETNTGADYGEGKSGEGRQGEQEAKGGFRGLPEGEAGAEKAGRKRRLALSFLGIFFLVSLYDVIQHYVVYYHLDIDWRNNSDWRQFLTANLCTCYRRFCLPNGHKATLQIIP